MDLLESRDIDCNYIYDEYINNSKIYEGLKGAFKLDLSTSLALIKLLEYIPIDLDDISQNDSKEDLIAAKRDVLIADAIKRRLSGKEYDEDLYDYATKIDIKKLISYKFRSPYFLEKYNNFLSLSDYEQDVVISMDEGKNAFTLNTEDLALFYLYKDKKSKKYNNISSKKI